MAQLGVVGGLRWVVGWCRWLRVLTRKGAGAACLALMLGGCGGPAPDGQGDEPDAFTTEPQPDAHTSDQDAAPDAGPAPSVPDAAPDSPALQADGGPDAGQAPVGSDAGPDAKEAAPAADAHAPLPDAAPDAGPAPICPDLANPSCRNAQRADDEIRATFPQACGAVGTPYQICGSVLEGHLVITYPMQCIAGAWRLAGYWSGLSWVYGPPECTRGCGAVGAMCAP